MVIEWRVLMKISTRGRYGLRALADLSLNSKGEYVSLKSIAERQNISENYLEQVFAILRKSDIVKSIRGSQGGYILSQSSNKITVGRILTVLEGELSVTDDYETDVESARDLEACIKHRVWDVINKSIEDSVSSITLNDIAEEYKKFNSGIYFDYSI